MADIINLVDTYNINTENTFKNNSQNKVVYDSTKKRTYVVYETVSSTNIYEIRLAYSDDEMYTWTYVTLFSSSYFSGSASIAINSAGEICVAFDTSDPSYNTSSSYCYNVALMMADTNLNWTFKMFTDYMYDHLDPNVIVTNDDTFYIVWNGYMSNYGGYVLCLGDTNIAMPYSDSNVPTQLSPYGMTVYGSSCIYNKVDNYIYYFYTTESGSAVNSLYEGAYDITNGYVYDGYELGSIYLYSCTGGYQVCYLDSFYPVIDNDGNMYATIRYFIDDYGVSSHTSFLLKRINRAGWTDITANIGAVEDIENAYKVAFNDIGLLFFIKNMYGAISMFTSTDGGNTFTPSDSAITEYPTYNYAVASNMSGDSHILVYVGTYGVSPLIKIAYTLSSPSATIITNVAYISLFGKDANILITLSAPALSAVQNGSTIVLTWT